MITTIKEYKKILESKRQATEIEIEVMDYLNDLRESGVTNMYGAVSYILKDFPNLDKKEATRILSLWMKNFNEEGNYNLISERNDFASIATIGKIKKEITIELDLKHSMHSMERQGRSSAFIKNSDIKETVDKATEQIIDLLINNTLNAGDPVWIYNSINDLNVVGSLIANKNSDVITFRVITCMFTKTFYNKNNTYKVTV